MDSYLEIAEDTIRLVRRPLSALQIIRAAYEHGIAPPHLRGRTQQKTMGARLSEDILRFREHSRFYRTAPGRFLLRELADDRAIPEELRRPIIARRRRRNLAQKRSLAFEWSALSQSAQSGPIIEKSVILDLIDRGRFHYTSSSPSRSMDEIVVWAFMMVVKDGAVLTYRQGHYREDRDTFMHRRTIGFYTPVIDDDVGLFDQQDHGIVSSGIRALATDLDLHDPALSTLLEQTSKLCKFVLPSECCDLLAVLAFNCPDWLDPTTKRLAINNLEWMDLSHLPNHREDFDPWSQAILRDTRSLSIGSP